MYVFVKQPNDVLDYDVDMSKWFSGVPGDDIQTVEIRITCPAEEIPSLEAGGAPHPAHVLMGASPVSFKIWLRGGTSYMDYIVTCVVKTEQDRTKEIEFKIKVRDK